MRHVIAVAIAASTTLAVSIVADTVRLKADPTYNTVRLKADTTDRSSVVSGFPPPPQATAGRLTIIISDLHLGPGRDAMTGQWQPTENFRWADAFRSFLRAIDQAGAGLL